MPERPLTASRLGELARLFVRLGVTAFGGPAAHIAMMHDEVVTRRGWLDDRRFLDLVGVTSLIPGPNSTEMTMHIGHERAGVRGLVVAGASFILPAAGIVAALAWAYVEYGTTPAGEGLLYGVVPVVLAIIAQAVVKLGRVAVTAVLPAVVAVAACVALLLGVHELVALFGGALLLFLVRFVQRAGGGAGGVGMLLAPLAAVPLPGRVVAAAATVESLGLLRLAAVFLKVGGLLYGSGYVLVAFLRNDLVDRLGILTERELLDAVAVGQFTPGPVFTTATFIGWVLEGPLGAVVATVAIFLPGFVFVTLLQRLLPRLRDAAWTSDLLDGVNAAAVGLMVGVLLQLAGAALVDPLTVGLAVVAGIVLLRWSPNSAWLVAAGGAVGVLVTLAG